jgi:hypothetical protein
MLHNIIKSSIFGNIKYIYIFYKIKMRWEALHKQFILYFIWYKIMKMPFQVPYIYYVMNELNTQNLHNRVRGKFSIIKAFIIFSMTF